MHRRDVRGRLTLTREVLAPGTTGRWISEKDPGYPFLAAPFQALGVIRLAPMFYGGLGCLGLFAGALLWAVLATDVASRRRTWAGLAGFAALEAAVFARYTDLVVLGCAAVAVAVAWRLRMVPGARLGWWLGSVLVSLAGVATFDDLVYGGQLKSGYRPGEITFSLAAIPRNLRLMPVHLLEAMPMLVLGLASLAWMAGRQVRLRRAGGERAGGERGAPAGHCDVTHQDAARPDLAVGLALTGSWCGVWGLYAAYSWTAQPGLTTLQAVRFYVPAIGAIALLGAWLLVRVLPRASLAAVATAAVVVLMAGLGLWAFSVMRNAPFGGLAHRGGLQGRVAHAPGVPLGTPRPARAPVCRRP